MALLDVGRYQSRLDPCRNQSRLDPAVVAVAVAVAVVGRHQSRLDPAAAVAVVADLVVSTFLHGLVPRVTALCHEATPEVP